MFFFKKKNQKTFPHFAPTFGWAKSGKVFLLLFLQKKKNPYTMLRSTNGWLSMIRPNPNGDRSSVVNPPWATSSATPRPVAGECCMPWPEKPAAWIRLGHPGCGPITPFWSKVLYS